jgi:hypothetical protein
VLRSLIAHRHYSQRPEQGACTGLRRLDGSKKPSWFAFGNVR